MTQNARTLASWSRSSQWPQTAKHVKDIKLSFPWAWISCPSNACCLQNNHPLSIIRSLISVDSNESLKIKPNTTEVQNYKINFMNRGTKLWVDSEDLKFWNEILLGLVCRGLSQCLWMHLVLFWFVKCRSKEISQTESAIRSSRTS